MGAGDANKFRWAVCDEAFASRTQFSFRIARNPKRCELYVGLSPARASIQSWTAFQDVSWLLETFRCCLWERGRLREWSNTPTSYACASTSTPNATRRENRSKPVTGLAEGAVVTVEKDMQQRAIRFLVNGDEVQDTYGHPYGWRSTDLPEKEFASLVGAALLYWTGDEVQLQIV